MSAASDAATCLGQREFQNRHYPPARVGLKALSSRLAPRGAIRERPATQLGGRHEGRVDVSTQVETYFFRTGAEPPGPLDASVSIHCGRETRCSRPTPPEGPRHEAFHAFVLSGAAALLLSTSLQASEPASSALAQDAASALRRRLGAGRYRSWSTARPARRRTRSSDLRRHGAPRGPRAALGARRRVPGGSCRAQTARGPRSRPSRSRLSAERSPACPAASSPAAASRGGSRPGSACPTARSGGSSRSWASSPARGRSSTRSTRRPDVPPSAERCGLELLADPYPDDRRVRARGGGGRKGAARWPWPSSAATPTTSTTPTGAASERCRAASRRSSTR
jgi:hypothetical protein